MLVILVPPTLAVAGVPAPLVVPEVAGPGTQNAPLVQTVSTTGSCAAPSGYDDVVPVLLVATQGPAGISRATVAETLVRVARDLCGLTLLLSEVRSVLPRGDQPRTSVVSSARSPAGRGCCSTRSVAEDSALRTH